MQYSSSVIKNLRDKLKQERELAVNAFRKQLQPDILLTKLSNIADKTLFELIEYFPLPKHACLAAVGGYGRGELYPGSDLDLLILLQQEPEPAELSHIEELIAALWDIGLEPGLAVRTIEQCISNADQDITIQTSLLEARYLTGNLSLFQAFSLQIQASLDIQEFYLAKLAEMRQRHSRYKNTPYALEPNCKESPGAIRDLQILLWLARAASYANTWQDLVQTDLLTSSEHRSLRRASLAFKRLRIELHLLSGRGEDRLLFDLQQPLAKIYGFKDKPQRRASEILMQRYYWAARVISQLNRILMQGLEEAIFPNKDLEIKYIDENFYVKKQLLFINHENTFKNNPALLLKIFLLLQQNQTIKGMSASTLRAIWHARKYIDSQFRNNPVNHHTFLQILKQENGLVQALKDMNMWNILPRYIPVFRKIVGQMQHDLVHIYTVDEHVLMVVKNLYGFTLPENSSEHPLASQLMANFKYHWLLYIAALFHDIAKGRGGDHSTLGALDVRNFAIKHGLTNEQIDLLEFLVREHLTMSQTAQKKDLSDPNTIHQFASIVANPQYLDALYLLTVADIKGTNPNIWNSWKGKLLENLYYQTINAINSEKLETDTILSQRKQQAIEIIKDYGISKQERLAFWNQLDIAYFLRHDASDIAWHTKCLYKNSLSTIVKTRVIGKQEALQILVYAPDRSDLFLDICSYFDNHQISIQDARIHTTKQAWALDSFIVLMSADNYSLRSSYVEQGLLNTINAPGHKNMANKRVRSRRAQAFPITPIVNLESINQGKNIRLSLVAIDRVGLLHDLSMTFNQHKAELKMAKIMTLGDRVEDIFILAGPIINNPTAQLALERNIRKVLNQY